MNNAEPGDTEQTAQQNRAQDRQEQEGHLAAELATATIDLSRMCTRLAHTFNVLADAHNEDAATIINSAHEECVHAQQLIARSVSHMSKASQAHFKLRCDLRNSDRSRRSPRAPGTPA